MDSNFIASVFATPPVVLGRKLKPFCCGHASLLDGLESAYIRGGAVNSQELIVAVWICSNTFEVGKHKITEELEELTAECLTWGASVGVWNFKEAHAIFTRYMEDHTRAPERWKKKGSDSSRAPWPLVVATTLMQELMVSESRAWNMPLQEALWYFAAISERQGDKSLVTEEDRDRRAIARANRANNEAAIKAADAEVSNG